MLRERGKPGGGSCGWWGENIRAVPSTPRRTKLTKGSERCLSGGEGRKNPHPNQPPPKSLLKKKKNVGAGFEFPEGEGKGGVVRGGGKNATSAEQARRGTEKRVTSEHEEKRQEPHGSGWGGSSRGSIKAKDGFFCGGRGGGVAARARSSRNTRLAAGGRNAQRGETNPLPTTS